MAIPTNIKTLLSGNVVEWARVEFKETWNAEASLKTICAFANDIDNWGGGYIVIGVKEQDGRPSFPLQGVPPEKIDAYQKDLLNKCKLIQPEYLPIVEVADYDGKKFIVIWAPGGNSRPYSSPKSFSKDSKERIHYIRKMASTIAPSEAEKRDLYNLANNIPFDDRVNHEAELADLNITLIQQYLKEIGSSLYEESTTMDFSDLCKSMNIVNTLPEYTKPKNVGLMFFSLEPERFFPCAQIDVVEFPDDTGSQIQEKIFRGPLHHQLREALQYIQNSVLQERVVKTDGVAEANRFFNYPYAAVEEALCNAVYHKGYDEREPIEVRIEPDRIIIISHPGADRSISLEGLREYRAYSRRYRNRRIGEFLKEMHLTEGRNTGFRKICNALKSNGSPEPLFETDDARTYFAATIYIHPEWMLRLISAKKLSGAVDSNFSREKMSILSAVKLCMAYYSHKDIVWVPISLEEMLRVSGGAGYSQKDGLLSAKNLGFEKGATSDDLLMVGIEGPVDDLSLLSMENRKRFGAVKSYAINFCINLTLPKQKLLPKILRTCVPLNISPLASRSKGYYNTANGTIRSAIERKELKP